MMPGPGAFAGTRATYVALSAVTVLTLALLTSIWHSDVSGSIAVLGLLSIYMSSTELLVLFIVLCPVSVVIDIIRLTGWRTLHSGGWLLFFTLAEMVAKVAGTVFGWSLHRSILTGGEGGGGAYQPMNVGSGPGSAPGGGGGGYGPPAGSSGGGAGGGGSDPFAGYAPPRQA